MSFNPFSLETIFSILKSSIFFRIHLHLSSISLTEFRIRQNFEGNIPVATIHLIQRDPTILHRFVRGICSRYSK